MQLKSKRLLSLFLVFMMILSVFPLQVFGAGSYTNGTLGSSIPDPIKGTAGSSDYSKLDNVTMWGMKITIMYAPIDEAKSDFANEKYVYKWEEAIQVSKEPIYLRGSKMIHKGKEIVPQWYGKLSPFYLMRNGKKWNQSKQLVSDSHKFNYFNLAEDFDINEQDMIEFNSRYITEYYQYGITAGNSESNIKMQDFLNRIMDMENPGSGTEDKVGKMVNAFGFSSILDSASKNTYGEAKSVIGNLYKNSPSTLAPEDCKLTVPGLAAGVTDGVETDNPEYLKSFYQNPYVLDKLFLAMNSQNRRYGYDVSEAPIVTVDDYLVGRYGDFEAGAYKIFIEPCMYRRYAGEFAVMTYQEIAAQHRQVGGSISKSLAKNFGVRGVAQIANSMYLEYVESCLNMTSSDLKSSYSENLLNDENVGLGMWVISSPEVWKQNLNRPNRVSVLVEIEGVDEDGNFKFKQLYVEETNLISSGFYTEKDLIDKYKDSPIGYQLTNNEGAISNVPIITHDMDVYKKNEMVGIALLNDVLITNEEFDSTTLWEEELPYYNNGNLSEHNIKDKLFTYVDGLITRNKIIKEMFGTGITNKNIQNMLFNNEYKNVSLNDLVVDIFSASTDKIDYNSDSPYVDSKIISAAEKMKGLSVKEVAFMVSLSEYLVSQVWDLNEDGMITESDLVILRSHYMEDVMDSFGEVPRMTYYDEAMLGVIDREKGEIYIPENEDGSIDTSVPNTIVLRYIFFPEPQQLNVVEKVYPSGKKKYEVCDPVSLESDRDLNKLYLAAQGDADSIEYVNNDFGDVIIQEPIVALPESAEKPKLVEWVTNKELPFKDISNGILPKKGDNEISGNTPQNIEWGDYPKEPYESNLYVKWTVNMPYDELDPPDPSGHGSGDGSFASVSDKVPEWRLSKYNSSIASLVEDPSMIPYACMNLNLTNDETTHATSTLTPSGKYNFKTINPNGQETVSSNTPSNMSMNTISNGYLSHYNSAYANTTFHSKAVPKSSPSITHSLTSAYVTMDGIVNMIKSTATSGLVAAQWQTNESAKNGLLQHNISTAYVPNSSVGTYSKIGLLRYGVYNKDTYTHERSIYYHYYCGGLYCSGHCGCYTTPEYRSPSGVSYYTGNYNLTTDFNRYIPQSTTVLNVDAKLTEENAYTSYSYQSGDVMKVYPEYGMLFANDSGEESIKWVVGDKAREIKPVFYQTLRFKTYVQPNSTGSSVATDSRALTAKNKFNANDKNKQVIYKGAGVNTAFQLYRDGSKNNAALLTVKTFALEYNDTLGVQNAWGMNGYKPEEQHKKLVDSINGDKATAYEKLFINNDGATYNGGVKQQQTNSFIKDGETVFTHELIIRGGHLIGIKLNGETTPISIQQLKSKAGYADLYQAIIESKLYNEGNDKSQTVFKTFEHKESTSAVLEEDTYANLLNSARNTTNGSGLVTPDYAKVNVGDNWYSEDTTVLVLREYVTNFKVPSISFSDKLSLQVNGLNTPVNKTEFFNKMARGHIYLKYELPVTLPNGTNTKAYFEYDSLNNPQMSSRIEIIDRSLGYQGAAYLVPNVSITDTTRQ